MPQGGIEPAPSALEGEVLATGPPEKSPRSDEDTVRSKPEMSSLPLPCFPSLV